MQTHRDRPPGKPKLSGEGSNSGWPNVEPEFVIICTHTRDTVVIVALKSPSCSEFVVRNSFAKTHFLCTLVRHDQSVSPISPESRSLTSFSSRTILIRQKSGDKTDVRNKIRG